MKGDAAMFKFAKDEKGAVAILLVLSITAIIIICSFVLDFGMVFYNSVRL